MEMNIALDMPSEEWIPSLLSAFSQEEGAARSAWPTDVLCGNKKEVTAAHKLHDNDIAIGYITSHHITSHRLHVQHHVDLGDT
jgi:hypothetical protein